MAGGKFIGWALDLIPGVVKFIKKGVRANEVQKIDSAVDSGDDKYINGKLRDIQKKYDRDVKGAS